MYVSLCFQRIKKSALQRFSKPALARIVLYIFFFSQIPTYKDIKCIYKEKKTFQKTLTILTKSFSQRFDVPVTNDVHLLFPLYGRIFDKLTMMRQAHTHSIQFCLRSFTYKCIILVMCPYYKNNNNNTNNTHTRARASLQLTTRLLNHETCSLVTRFHTML